ncbi:MAG: AEC family transporter [Akkermansiaceae bacterium]
MTAHILTVLIASLPVFLIVFLGVGLRKWNVIDKAIDQGITKLLLNVLLPCFILHNILGSKVASDLPKVLTLAALGAGIVLISLAIAYTLSPKLGLGKGEGRRSFTVAVGLQNYGFIPVPLLMSLYADSELLATLFLHSLGVELAIFTVGVMIFTGKFTLNPRILLKGPILAVFLGVFLNVTNLQIHLPTPLLTSVSWLGSSAIPLSLVAIGMSIGEILPETKYTLKISLSAVFFRLMLLPTLIISIAYLLPLDEGVKRVLLVQAAMPAALFPIVLARHYGGKPALVAEVAIVTSIISFLTMPLVIAAGSYLLSV